MSDLEGNLKHAADTQVNGSGATQISADAAKPKEARSLVKTLAFGLVGLLAVVGATAIGYVAATATSDSSEEATTGDVVGLENTVDSGSDDGANRADTDQSGATTPESPSVKVDPSAPNNNPDAISALSATDIQAQLDEFADGDPTPRAFFAGGKVTIIGAVPSQEVSDLLGAGASADMGPQNVTNNVVVDPSSTWTPDQGLPIIFTDTVLFAPGSIEVAPEFMPIVEIGAALLKREPNATITIITHTDSSGSEAANLELSEQRAHTLEHLWLDRGAKRSQLITDPRGEKEASDTNDEAIKRSERRAELVVDNIIGS